MCGITMQRTARDNAKCRIKSMRWLRYGGCTIPEKVGVPPQVGALPLVHMAHLWFGRGIVLFYCLIVYACDTPRLNRVVKGGRREGRREGGPKGGKRDAKWLGG